MFGFNQKKSVPEVKRTSSFIKTGGDSETSTSVVRATPAVETLGKHGRILKTTQSTSDVRRIVRNAPPKVENFRFVKFRVSTTGNPLGCPYKIYTTVRLLDGSLVHYEGSIKDFGDFLSTTQHKNHKLWLDATEETTEEEATIEEADSEEEEDEAV